MRRLMHNGLRVVLQFQGAFAFDSVPANTGYTLTVSLAGYETMARSAVPSFETRPTSAVTRVFDALWGAPQDEGRR